MGRPGIWCSLLAAPLLRNLTPTPDLHCRCAFASKVAALPSASAERETNRALTSFCQELLSRWTTWVAFANAWLGSPWLLMAIKASGAKGDANT